MESAPTRQSKRLLCKRLKSGQSVDVRPLENDTESYLLLTPLEIILKIAQFITLRDLLNIRVTCLLGRIKIDNDAIWKEKLYGSYGLSDKESEILKSQTSITGNWMYEIKKSICINLWIALRAPDSFPFRSEWTSRELDTSEGYKRAMVSEKIVLHPACTILGLIQLICHRLGVDYDQALIGLYPVKWMRFLRDHKDSSLEWDSSSEPALVGGSLSSCIQEQNKPYHIIVHVVQTREVWQCATKSRRIFMIGCKWFIQDIQDIQCEVAQAHEHLTKLDNPQPMFGEGILFTTTTKKRMLND